MMDDEEWLAKQLAPNKKNEAHWRERLKGQGELKATPPRSAWRRFMDSVEETVRQGPGALIGGRIAPLVETGDGKSYEERRKAYAAKEKQRREDVAAVDPADSAGDYAADIAGGIIGSVISDPTNLVNPAGGLGRKILGNAAVGGLGDAALQGGELIEGFRDEYDPIRTGINVAAAPAIIGGAELVKKGAKAIARPPKALDLDTAVGIGNKFGKVTSTIRTPARNKKVGGAKNSHHLYGRAIDIARGKGVTHKQIERAYRRAGYDIIESLDEGDHSHLAFNFKGSKTPEVQGPDDLGEVKLVRNELPPVDEMARVNDALAPEEVDNILRMAERDPVADQAPLIDSYHERFTPYVDKPTPAANDRTQFDDFGSEEAYWNSPEGREMEAQGKREVMEYAAKFNLPYEEAEARSILGFDMKTNEPDPYVIKAIKEGQVPFITGDPDVDAKLANDILRKVDPESALTPAERQEMDASAVRPDVDPTTPKPLGGGKSGDPANDVNVHDIKDARETKELKGFHKDLMGEVGRRAREADEVGRRYHEEGKLPYKVGDRFTTEHGRSRGEEPWTVKGYFVDPKDPDHFGYYVERGKKGDGPDDPNSTYEASRMSRSNPKFDEKMMKDASYKERTGKDWIPLSERTDWQLVGKPKLDIVKTIKDIIDDEEGAFRPFGRDPVTNERVPLADLDPEDRIAQLASRYKPKVGNQRRLYAQERSRRGSSLGNLQRGEATRENIAQQGAALRGQLPKVAGESIAHHFSEADFVQLANKINQSPRLLPFQKYNAHKALLKLLDPEGSALPTAFEIKLLSEVYKPDFIRALMANRSFMEQFHDHAISAINVPRAIMSSMDFSAPFRQGIGLVHKKEFWKSFGHMFKMWADAARGGTAHKEWIDSVKSDPRWQQAHDAGLYITDPDSHFLADREEDFITDWAERIPIAGRFIKASNHAYSGFLNKLRWDTFKNLLDQKEAMGDVVDDKFLKDTGKFINMATGRGNMGKNLNAAAPALSAMFFSPRLIASRIQTLASPITYAKADPLVRKEAWKSLMAMSAYYVTLGGIAKYGLGMDVETDPRSPDFMKAKIGNTRYDFMSGYQQYIRLGAQLLSDSTITAKGKEKALTSNEEYKADTRRDVLIRFFLNKLAPIPGLASDYLEGSDPTGKPFTWKDAAASRLLPMASQDIADAMKEWGPKGAAMGLPGLFGWSVQTYDANKPREKPVKEEAVPSEDEAWLKSQLEGSSSSSADDKWLKEQGL